MNAAAIKDAILARVDGTKEWTDKEIVALVLDIEGTNQLDTTTVDMLVPYYGALAEHLPVMIIEGTVTALCIAFLRRVQPSMLPGYSPKEVS